MTEIEELTARIRKLPSKDFQAFRDWFYQWENERWDQQIQSDFKAGKFDALIEKAKRELAQGKARDWIGSHAEYDRFMT